MKVSEKVSESDVKKPETYGKWKHWRKVPHAERVKIAGMTDVQDVIATYGVIERTAYNWMESARSDQAVVADLVAAGAAK